MVSSRKHRRKRRWLRRSLVAFALAWLASATWQVFKPLPAGVGVAWPERAGHDLALFADLTWVDDQEVRHSEQTIFDEVLRLVGQAQRLIVLDMFLFNDFAGSGDGHRHRPLSRELTDALIGRKQQIPTLQVLVITDPVNTVYGGVRSAQLERLAAGGVTVVTTRLARLRAPNPTWEGLWQLCCRWLGNRTDGGWLPNPLGPGKVTLRSWLVLLNLKANHRKSLVVDHGDTWTGLVTSANPHDASSAHGNIALRFSGEAALDLLRSEAAAIAFSGGDALPIPTGPVQAGTLEDGTDASNTGARAQVLTEAAIRDALITSIDAAGSDERLDVAVFYLSHRGIVTALLRAHARGVAVRVLLDPNEDAFGRKKNGIPNRQVGLELDRAGIPVRWCDTHGEQCHGKFLLRSGGAQAELILGSANFTRRNLDNYNLETNLRVVAASAAAVIVDAQTLFERQWRNEPGRHYSIPFAHYRDPSRWRYWLYRFTEATGLSSY